MKRRNGSALMFEQREVSFEQREGSFEQREGSFEQREKSQTRSGWTFKLAKSFPGRFREVGRGVLEWPEKAWEILWTRKLANIWTRHADF